MPGMYQTKQRNHILTCLVTYGHVSLSAKDIYDHCAKSNTPVGLATIYRQLDVLVSEGKIKKITSLDGGSLRFQYIGAQTPMDAFYLKCDGCGKMMPVDCHLLEEVTHHMNHTHRFKINASRSVLYGRCGHCQ